MNFKEHCQPEIDGPPTAANMTLRTAPSEWEIRVDIFAFLHVGRRESINILTIMNYWYYLYILGDQMCPMNPGMSAINKVAVTHT